jgi:hypothetical protein
VVHYAIETIRSIWSTVLTVVAALMLGFGVPMFWTWTAWTIAGSGPQMSASLWVLVGLGIIVTYWLLLLVGGRIRGRWGGDGDAPTTRRQSWNRSMRDEPFRPGSGKSDPVERIFVLAATLGFVLFMIWFAFFAGASCSGPCGTVG